MSSLTNVGSLHLPSIIGYRKNDLSKIILEIDLHYDEWCKIKKDKATGLPKTFKDGTVKKRYIRPSKPLLNIIQLRIKNRILEQISLPANIHGGRRKHSNITNAKKHQGKNYMLSTDLHEFFPSVKSKHVYETFLELGYNKQFAYYITKLTTWKGELPQGTPTSTHIANIVFLKIDFELIAFCEIHNITYTRFVDDLTFSSQKNFQELVPEILNIIQQSGFCLSRRKTIYSGWQTVTGIQVFNDRIDASKNVIDKIESLTNLPEGDPKYLIRYRDQVLKTNVKKK